MGAENLFIIHTSLTTTLLKKKHLPLSVLVPQNKTKQNKNLILPLSLFVSDRRHQDFIYIFAFCPLPNSISPYLKCCIIFSKLVNHAEHLLYSTFKHVFAWGKFLQLSLTYDK